MKRKQARETAFSILFEYGFDTSVSPLGHYETAISVRDVEEDSYVRNVLAGVEAHLADIDAAIDAASSNWKKERISRVSMAILRLAVYEMFYREDIPLRVSLNEAVELSKSFDEDKAYGFVNGVLNAIMADGRCVGQA
ncbi:MAG: transcription antitermination factor NusB [Clostridia bacterium]|nr:transcription antitermination factor NusB [Clostridia bacterium]